MKKNAHCSYCGAAFAPDLPFPRTCAACSQTTYVNPLPVSVLVVPIHGEAGEGVLCVRRGIEPRKGQLALPGGYINLGESWQEAGARELFEETGVRVEAQTICDLCVRSAPDSTVLIFGVSAPLREAELPPFVQTPETSERLVLRAPAELAFSLHTGVLRDYFATRR